MDESTTRDLSPQHLTISPKRRYLVPTKPTPLEDFNIWVRTQPSFAELEARAQRHEEPPIRETRPLHAEWHGHVINVGRRTPTQDPAKFTLEEWQAWNAATHAPIPWWLDTSAAAQRRRAIKRHRVGPSRKYRDRDMASYWSEVRASQDLVREGQNAKAVAALMKCSARNIHYRMHLRVPTEHYGIALSEVLQAKERALSEMPRSDSEGRGGGVFSFLAESRITRGLGQFDSGEFATFNELIAEAQRLFGVTASGSLDTPCEVTWEKLDSDGHNQLYSSELAVPFDPHRLHQQLIQSRPRTALSLLLLQEPRGAS